MRSFCLLLCLLLLNACSEYDKTMYVTRHTNTRNTTTDYPFISGDVFRQFSDHIVDDTHVPFYPHLVKEKDIVFVKTKYLKRFVKHMHPKIKNPYILVTHNGDEEIPGEFTKLLNDHKILKWFGMNVTLSHPKLIALPIGFGNAGNKSCSEEIIADLQMHPVEKQRLLYLNFTTKTHPDRESVKQYFLQQSFCTVEEPKLFKDYIEEVMRSKFNVSPRGNGIDCNRVWETILVGTIPIVKTSPLDSLYQDLPILIVNDWSEVTEEFLEKKFIEMSAKHYDTEKMYADYWLKLIDSYTKGKYSPTAMQEGSRIPTTILQPSSETIPCL